MPYQVEFSPAAAREFRKLLPDVQRQIRPAIDALEAHPYPRGVKKLKGGSSEYRVRVGSYRIIYEVREQVLTILILSVGDRKDVYR